MQTLLQDLRFGLRRLRRTPVFTAIAIASLAIGIGANTAIFSLVNAVILRRAPIERPEELLDVYFRQAGFPHSAFSYPDYRDLREDTRDVFVQLSATRLAFVQHERGDETQPLAAELVNGEYFLLRGIRPALGRLLQPEDDVSPGGHAVVVLGHGYWTSAFGADRSVVGSTVRLNGQPFEVVGVAPEVYEGELRGLSPQIYLPILMLDRIEGGSTNQLESRGSHSIFVKARRAAGVGIAQAEAALASFTERMREAYPDQWTAQNSLVAVPTAEVILNPSIDTVLVAAAGLLSVVVGLVLLIACANLAGFLLAQAQNRRREIAIRLAIGARRGTLIRQLLTETMLLAVVGGVLGALLSVAMLGALTSADLPLPFPITLNLSPDLRVLGFTALVTIAAGLLFGLTPSLQATRPALAPTLKEESAAGAPRHRLALRDVLVAGQVAVSLVLLVGAGLFLRSFQARQNVDPGFGTEPAAVVTFDVPADRYDRDAARNLVRRALENVQALDGVSAAGLTSNLHLNLLNTTWTDVNIAGHEPPPGERAFQIDDCVVDPGFFEAAGITILRGRNFDDGLDRPDGAPVVIVNQAFVDRFWPGEDAVGRTIRLEGDEVRIVGVSATAKIRAMGEPPRPFLYRPYSQAYTSSPTIVARTAGDAAPYVARVVRVLRDLDPDLVLYETKTMERHLGALLLPARLGALVLVLVAAIALGLAAIGLYGVVSYAVARRTREVGIRIALGAEPRGVVGLVMAGGLKLVASGAAVGLVVSVALSNAIRGMLFGVALLDPVTFVSVTVVLAVVALLAAWLPARRASRLDPLVALRQNG